METNQHTLQSAEQLAARAAELAAQARLTYHQARALRKQEKAALKMAEKIQRNAAKNSIREQQERLAASRLAEVTLVKEQINQILQSAGLTVADLKAALLAEQSV
jgi:hypothetical protein